MKQKIRRFAKYLLLLGLAVLAAEIFWPRHYKVSTQASRASTQYWDLSTGSRIAFTLIQAQGSKKATPIIYLHGGPGGPISDSNIKSLTPLSQDGYDVYLYDQIGGGLSDRLDKIEAYTADRHKRDLEAIIQKIGAEKVILLGQSWGGILATLFAADHPEQLEKLIFSCPGPILPFRPELKSQIAPDSLQLREPIFSNAQGNRETSNLRTRAMSYLATAFGVKLASDEEADDFYTFQSSKVNKSVVCDTTKFPQSTGGGGFYVSIRTVQSFYDIPDQRSKLKAVRCPVLVLKGQCDNQKWGFTKEYLDIFPNSHLVMIPHAGHAIAFEQPDLYLQTIRDFLNR
jgi:proline iminopeptidase